MNEIVVNGVALPTPSKMTCSDFDLSDLNRNSKGYMIGQIIRENVHKVECTWNRIKGNDYMTIRNAIASKKDLNVNYFIPEEDSKGTIICYVGDRTTPIYAIWDGVPVYENFSVNFIEM
jgi:hypothetical protein